MRVLMFGWEFPPHISGGLGTACYGLTKALSEQHVEITLVLPKVRDGHEQEQVKVVGPKELIHDLSSVGSIEELQASISEMIKVHEVDSPLHPYMNEESYKNYLSSLQKYRRGKESSLWT